MIKRSWLAAHLEVLLAHVGHVHQGEDAVFDTHGVVEQRLDADPGEVDGAQAVLTPDFIDGVVVFLGEFVVLVGLDVHLDLHVLLGFHPPLLKVFPVVGGVAAGHRVDSPLGGLHDVAGPQLVDGLGVPLDGGVLDELYRRVVVVDPVGTAQGLVQLPDAHAGVGGGEGLAPEFAVVVPAHDAGLPQHFAAGLPVDDGTVQVDVIFHNDGPSPADSGDRAPPPFLL